MAKDKKSFIIYVDWIETFNELSNENAGKLVKHLFEYVNDLNPEPPNDLIKMCFIPIKQTLKRDLIKYGNVVKRNTINGSKGGRPKNPKEPKKPTGLTGNPKEPKKADSDSVNDSVIVNVNKIKDRKDNFKKSLAPFLEKYGKDILNNFFGYWTEHGENDKKMRFEKEKSFGISRRLSTWNKREKDFNGNKSEKTLQAIK